jgi:16S rRNA (adenine1518-N6/adenine1519-N6)-dimethyltransferase
MNVREILRKYRIRPSKFRDEYFLIDENVLDREVGYAKINKKDVVLEIGAGIGNLTEALAAKAKKVIAVEKNARFCEILRTQNLKNVEIMEGDILKMDFKKFPCFNKIVSNLPYGISSPITFKLLDHEWDIAVLTYQQDFARRFEAKPGSKDYSRLTVAINYHCDVELLETVGSSSFYPRPGVRSAIVRLKQKKPPFRTDESFWLLIKACFQHKRKKVRNALIDSALNIGIKRDMLREITKERIFQLKVVNCDLEDFKNIWDKLRKRSRFAVLRD